MNDYYVYVYIDPRNYEEFYYGKGKGSRKEAHLTDESDTEKANRISVIKKQGLEPIVRVIARNLSEHDAFLVASLDFDDLDALKAAFASPAGHACAADRKRLAPEPGDALMLLYDTTTV